MIVTFNLFITIYLYSGCIEPRNCGVQVGLTGDSKSPGDNFFRGLIDEV